MEDLLGDLLTLANDPRETRQLDGFTEKAASAVRASKGRGDRAQVARVEAEVRANPPRAFTFDAPLGRGRLLSSGTLPNRLDPRAPKPRSKTSDRIASSQSEGPCARWSRPSDGHRNASVDERRLVRSSFSIQLPRIAGTVRHGGRKLLLRSNTGSARFDLRFSRDTAPSLRRARNR
jgi:hypothetical protein